MPCAGLTWRLMQVLPYLLLRRRPQKKSFGVRKKILCLKKKDVLGLKKKKGVLCLKKKKAFEAYFSRLSCLVQDLAQICQGGSFVVADDLPAALRGHLYCLRFFGT